MKIFSFMICVILVCSCGDSENKVVDLRDGDEIEGVSVEGEGESVSEDVSEGEEGVSALREPQGAGTGTKVSDGKEWTYKVVLVSEKNWGYQLFQNGVMKINQTSIPSVQGIAGFDSQEKADRTAKHIISKLEKGIFPPTVDKKELDSLKVLRN